MFFAAILCAWEVGSTPIAPVEDYEVQEAVQSDDLSKLAVVYVTETGVRLEMNGELVGEFANVWDVSFTKDGNLVYVTLELDENGKDQMFFVMGDKKYGPYDYVGQYVISEDGQHYAFKIGTGGQWDETGYYTGGKYSVYHDGKQSKQYDMISNTIVLSPDGQEVAYVVRKGGKWNDEGSYVGGKEAVVRGSKKDSYHGLCYGLVYSPDSKHLAYLAVDGGKWRDGVYKGGKTKVYVDSKGMKKKYPFITNVVFDSKGTVYYIAGLNGKWSDDNQFYGGEYALVKNNKEGKKKPFIKGLAATQQGTVTYVYSEGGRWEDQNYVGGKYYIMSGPRRTGPYTYTSTAILSQKQDYFVYLVSEGGRWDPTGYYEGGKYTVRPNKGGASRSYDNITNIVLADSVGFAAVVYKGGQWSEGSYTDGDMLITWASYESPVYDYIFPESINLSKDGKNVAFTVPDSTQAEHVVINGHMEENSHDFVFDRMLFSQDGKLLAYNSIDSGQVYLNVVKVPSAR